MKQQISHSFASLLHTHGQLSDKQIFQRNSNIHLDSMFKKIKERINLVLEQTYTRLRQGFLSVIEHRRISVLKRVFPDIKYLQNKLTTSHTHTYGQLRGAEHKINKASFNLSTIFSPLQYKLNQSILQEISEKCYTLIHSSFTKETDLIFALTEGILPSRGNNYLMLPQPASNKLKLLNMKKENKELKFQRDFNKNFAAINLDYSVIVAGGDGVRIRAVNRVNQACLNGRYNSLNAMQSARKHFPLIKRKKGDHILAIGGENPDTIQLFLKDCEEYSRIANQWKILPSLLRGRADTAAVMIEPYSVLVFCGSWRQKYDYQSCQKLSFNKQDQGWSNFTISSNYWKRRYRHEAYCFGQLNSIIIFGSQEVKCTVELKYSKQSQIEEVKHYSMTAPFFRSSGETGRFKVFGNRSTLSALKEDTVFYNKRAKMWETLK